MQTFFFHKYFRELNIQISKHIYKTKAWDEYLLEYYIKVFVFCVMLSGVFFLNFMSLYLL